MNPLWIASYVILWVVVLALVGLLLVLYRQLGEMYLGTPEGRSRDGIRIGGQAPEFSLFSQDGQVVSVPSKRGKPMLLVFGLPTCGPCQSLMPDLRRFAVKYQEKIEVYFVAGPNDEENQIFAQRHMAVFPVLTQQGLETANAYKVRQSPFAYYLNAEGIVVDRGIVNRLAQLEKMVGSSSDSYIPLQAEPLARRA